MLPLSSSQQSFHYTSSKASTAEKILWRQSLCNRDPKVSAVQQAKIEKNKQALSNEERSEQQFVSSLTWLHSCRDRQVVLKIRNISRDALKLKTSEKMSADYAVAMVKEIVNGTYGSRIFFKLIDSNVLLQKVPFFSFLLIDASLKKKNLQDFVWFKNFNTENLIQEVVTLQEKIPDHNELLYTLVFRSQCQEVTKLVSTIPDENFSTLLELVRPHFAPKEEMLSDIITHFAKIGDFDSAAKVSNLLRSTDHTTLPLARGIFGAIKHNEQTGLEFAKKASDDRAASDAVAHYFKEKISDLESLQQVENRLQQQFGKESAIYQRALLLLLKHFSDVKLIRVQQSDLSRTRSTLLVLMRHLTDENKSLCMSHCLMAYSKAFLKMQDCFDACKKWLCSFETMFQSASKPQEGIFQLALFSHNQSEFQEFYRRLDSDMRGHFLQTFSWIVSSQQDIQAPQLETDEDKREFSRFTSCFRNESVTFDPEVEECYSCFSSPNFEKDRFKSLFKKSTNKFGFLRELVFCMRQKLSETHFYIKLQTLMDQFVLKSSERAFIAFLTFPIYIGSPNCESMRRAIQDPHFYALKEAIDAFMQKNITNSIMTSMMMQFAAMGI